MKKLLTISFLLFVAAKLFGQSQEGGNVREFSTIAKAVTMPVSTNMLGQTVIVRDYSLRGDGGGGEFYVTNSVASTNTGTKFKMSTAGFSLQRKYKGSTFIEFFGASPIATAAANQIAIQLALYSFTNVVAGDGVFPITGTGTLLSLKKDGQSLTGMGEGTTLLYTGTDTNVTIIGNTTGLVLRRIAIRNLQITAATGSFGKIAIDLYNVSDSLVKDNFVNVADWDTATPAGGFRTGIRVYGTDTITGGAYRNLIIGNVIRTYNAGLSLTKGIDLSGGFVYSGPNASKIQNNIVWAPGGIGIFATNTLGLVLEQNVVEWYTKICMYLGGGNEGNPMIGNVVRDNYFEVGTAADTLGLYIGQWNTQGSAHNNLYASTLATNYINNAMSDFDIDEQSAPAARKISGTLAFAGNAVFNNGGLYSGRVSGVDFRPSTHQTNYAVMFGADSGDIKSMRITNTKRNNFVSIGLFRNLEGALNSDNYYTPSNTTAFGYDGIELDYSQISIIGTNDVTTADATVTPLRLMSFSKNGNGNTSYQPMTIYGSNFVNGTVTALRGDFVLAATTNRLAFGGDRVNYYIGELGGSIGIHGYAGAHLYGYNDSGLKVTGAGDVQYDSSTPSELDYGIKTNGTTITMVNTTNTATVHLTGAANPLDLPSTPSSGAPIRSLLVTSDTNNIVTFSGTVRDSRGFDTTTATNSAGTEGEYLFKWSTANAKWYFYQGNVPSGGSSISGLTPGVLPKAATSSTLSDSIISEPASQIVLIQPAALNGSSNSVFFGRGGSDTNVASLHWNASAISVGGTNTFVLRTPDSQNLLIHNGTYGTYGSLLMLPTSLYLSFGTSILNLLGSGISDFTTSGGYLSLHNYTGSPTMRFFDARHSFAGALSNDVISTITFEGYTNGVSSAGAGFTATAMRDWSATNNDTRLTINATAIRLTNQVASSMLRTDANKDVTNVVVGTGLTFDGTTLSSTASGSGGNIAPLVADTVQATSATGVDEDIKSYTIAAGTVGVTAGKLKFYASGAFSRNGGVLEVRFQGQTLIRAGDGSIYSEWIAYGEIARVSSTVWRASVTVDVGDSDTVVKQHFVENTEYSSADWTAGQPFALYADNDADSFVSVLTAYVDYVLPTGSAAAATISDEAFGVTWDGITSVAPSKNAVYDKLATAVTAPSAASGAGLLYMSLGADRSAGVTGIAVGSTTNLTGVGTVTLGGNIVFSATGIGNLFGGTFTSNGGEFQYSPTAGDMRLVNRGTYSFYADSNGNDGNPIKEYMWSTGVADGSTAGYKMVLWNSGGLSIQQNGTHVDPGAASISVEKTGWFGTGVNIGSAAASPTTRTIKIGGDGLGTDKTGSDGILEAGVSTGTGRSGDAIVKTGLTAATTGSTTNNISTRFQAVSKWVDLTESTATAFQKFTLATNNYAGGEIIATVYATDAAFAYQSLTSQIKFDAVNVGGTNNVTITQVDSTLAQIPAGGTLTCTYTIVDETANVFSIKANAASSLTQTALRVKWVIGALNSSDAITVTPQ